MKQKDTIIIDGVVIACALAFFLVINVVMTANDRFAEITDIDVEKLPPLITEIGN